MSHSDCARIRKALRSGASTPDEERHLFTCANCRADVRLGQAWKSLAPPAELETREPVDEALVARVLTTVRRDRRHLSRARAGLAAAAALLFFFLAGAAGQLVASATSGAEDAYAQLVGPSTLDSLLPE